MLNVHQMEELLWQARVLEEKAQEHTEWKMIVERQFDSQIERVRATLNRQRIANAELKRHIAELDNTIEALTVIAEDDL